VVPATARGVFRVGPKIVRMRRNAPLPSAWTGLAPRRPGGLGILRLGLSRGPASRLNCGMAASPNPPEDSLRTRSSLLRRVARLDSDSWDEFHATYRPLVLALALRTGLNPTEAAEAVQDVFTRLMTLLPQFDPDKAKGSFRSWLLGQARWRIADKLRERQRAVPAAEASATGTAPAEQLPSEPEFERIWNEEWRQHVLNEALRRLQETASARHFQVFDLYFRQDWSVPRIALELGMNPVTVYVVTHRLTRQLKAEVVQLTEEMG